METFGYVKMCICKYVDMDICGYVDMWKWICIYI